MRHILGRPWVEFIFLINLLISQGLVWMVMVIQVVQGVRAIQLGSLVQVVKVA